ncbi:hypothetical protein F4802DRAFT_549056 [Xylaria palmicola]|nr:hypothetical protein F4802DRAFT_549056 [Xylaria palmicola]
MRTRRQDKAVAAEAEAAAAASAAAATPANEEAPSTAVSSALDSERKDAPTSSTAVTISKLEGPTTNGATRKARSKLPPQIQFPLVAVISLAISELCYSLSWSHTQGVLAKHARLPGTWPEIAAIMGWRLFELGLGWFGDYDGYDITALNLLSQGPSLYLLFAHYNTPAPALLIIVVIETLATYIPFRLLRPLSRVHANPTAAPNGDILTDAPIALLTTLLAGAIYSVSLFFAYLTYLPKYLVVYFADLPSVERAHASSYVGLLPVTLVLGFAARVFIFTPTEATGRTPADAENEAFDPVKASLGETLRWNILGWSSQTKVAMKRTALTMLVSGVNTFLRSRFTIVGVEAVGAAAWSSVWVAAAAITGLALSAVAGV